ncbi:MAG: hypothetical protein K8E66_04860, partial [Phycisphaerales bacterium]|nr:hypothetical protein [Phycisphaerales bacterium]
MNTTFRWTTLTILQVVLAGSAGAQTWDLADDWSDALNPNGAWSYNGSTDTPISTSHADWDPTSDVFGPAQPAWAATPYPQNDHVPMVFKRVSATSSIDVPIGRVGMHGNEWNDPDHWVGVVWTSPVAGMVDVSGAVWHAHTGYSRQADWRVRWNGTVLTTGSIAAGDGYSSSVPYDLLTGTGGTSALQSISVAVGDTITLEFISLTTFATFVGADLTVSSPATTAVPLLGQYALGLAQNRPNPFRASTGITLTTTRPGPVRVEVFDVRGRRVRTLVDGEVGAGAHTYTWDARIDTGTWAAPGV